MIAVRDHRGFQRTTLALVGVATASWLVVGLGRLGTLGPVMTGALAAALGIVLAGAGRRRAAGALAGVAALATAAVTAEALAPGWWRASTAGWPEALVAPLAGLVAALGLVPLHLEVRLDPVGRALAAADGALGPDERALGRRAAGAEQRVREALDGERRGEARALRRLARALAMQTVAHGRKLRLLERAADAIDPAELDRQVRALRRDPARTTVSYAGALGALEEQRGHLAALRGATDRLRAHLHERVALLEGTALALAARRGARAADEAAALGPLVDRLRDVSTQAGSEAAALTALDG